MNFQIFKTETIPAPVPDYPGIAVSLKLIDWRPTPVGFDADGDPVYEPLTPDDIKKLEHWKAYRVKLVKYTAPIRNRAVMTEGLVQKTVVSPWFDRRNEGADQKAMHEVLGLAVRSAMV